MVSVGKLGAWFLLMIISYALVAMLNRPEPYEEAAAISSAGDDTSPDASLATKAAPFAE